MKKQLSYLLILCLLVACFAGCAAKPTTPTDVTPLEPNSVQLQENEAQQEQSLQEDSSKNEKPDPVQNPKNEQPTESDQEQQPVQSVDQKEPDKQPVGGKPAPPLSFRSGDVLGDFTNWIQTVPLMPEDVVPGSDEYYYYLKPDFQEMLINDRYYLLPTAPQGYTIHGIWVSAQVIDFYYEDSNGNLIMFGYKTKRTQLPNQLSTSNQKLVQFGGVQYLQEKNTYKGSTNLKLTRNYDKYTISVSCDNANKTGITPEQAANLFTFTKVDLPPLKAVMQ